MRFLRQNFYSIGRSALVSAMCLASLAACSRAPEPKIDSALAARGKQLFATCASCHNIDRKQNSVGPYLVGVYGRKAGSVASFNYSSALKGMNFDWKDDQLLQFLRSPQGFLPGTAMALQGLSESDAKAVIAYLQSRE